MARKEELRVGVIGAGGRGGLVMHAHDPKHGVRVVAGADVDPRAPSWFKQNYGPDVFTTLDYHELLRIPDIGAVFVTSPDFLHEEHAVAALNAGKAVYLEKPMAITIQGATAFSNGCHEKAKLYLGHNMRHMDVDPEDERTDLQRGPSARSRPGGAGIL